MKTAVQGSDTTVMPQRIKAGFIKKINNNTSCLIL